MDRQKNFEIKKILIPVDFSETSFLAIEHASFMARLLKAEITLLHCIETYTVSSQLEVGPYEDLTAHIENEAHIKLKELAKDIHQATGIAVYTHYSVGRIYKKIVEYAQHIQADIIVMGTHGVSGFKEFVAGSNAYRVVSDAKCPVITVQAHATKIGFKQIVMPITDSHFSRQKVSYVSSIASIYGAKVFIVGLIPSTGAEYESTFRVKIGQVEAYLTKHEVSYETVYMKESQPAKQVMNFAIENKADLIASVTEVEDGIEGFLIKSFPQQIVNHSSIPVLSIQPDYNYELTGAKL